MRLLLHKVTRKYKPEAMTISNVEEFVDYCEQCDRFFDKRSGCEADIREDEASTDQH